MPPWKAFFQTEKLTTRIHNILREYPPGLGTFKEFIQNADDAKAAQFSLLYDRSSRGSDSLLSPDMGEWQGPSLYIYNSASFSDKDFDGITQVGNSGKVSDPTTIGKYGLGFNCSYHFTDLVSFMSRDQLIYFDPHGLFLPEGMLGLRCNFQELPYPCNFKDIIDSYQFPEFNSMKIPGSQVDGTIFRLPLRTTEQAKRSLLSKVNYTDAEFMQLILQFSKEASEMILLLNHIEDIKIYVKEADGTVQQLSHIFISNSSKELQKNRATRNFPIEINDGNYKINNSTYTVHLTEKHANEEEKTSKWLISAISRHRELSEIEKEIDSSATIQWVNVATCCTTKLQSGTIYCSLPLPMKTGYPVHINGNFALSSNRRHLWEQSEGEQSGPAAFKSRWNHELANLVASAYFDLLEQLKLELNDPEELYQYWPYSKQSHFFQEHMVSSFVHYIVNDEYKLFWDKTKNQWVVLSNVIFPDSSLSIDDPFYSVLHSINLIPVFPPSSHLKLLQESGHVLPELSPKNLIEILKEIHTKTIRNASTADHLLNYLLRGIQDMSPHQVQNHIRAMDGLHVIPLYNNKIGTIRPAAKVQQNSVYLLCKNEEYMAVLPNCEQFVDATSHSFEKLQTRLVHQYSNVKLFSPAILPSFMSFIVPKTWYNVASVYISGRLLHEQVLNISVNYLKHKKKKGKQIPSGLVTAKDPSISVTELSEKLNLMWKFIQEFCADGNIPGALNSWPIVLVSTPEGEMVCTIDVCRRKGALPSETVKKYGEEGVRVLRQYGCRFYQQRTPILKKIIGKRTKIEALNSIIHYLATNRALEILRDDSIVLRKIVMSWIEDEEFPITKTQIESLPLFLNISGTESIRISSTDVIIPPNDIWYSTCKKHYANRTIDTKQAGNRFLLSKIASTVPTLKQFFARYLCDDLDWLPQSVCIRFLQEIGNMKESNSPWFAAHNKENKDIIHALQTRKLIVFNDGHRCNISEILDSSDSNLNNLLDTKDDKHSYAPLIYREDSLIQNVLKRLPVRSLSNFEIYYEIATKVANSSNMNMGKVLVKFLSNMHQSLNWSSTQYKRIRSIPFVPCWDLRIKRFIRFISDVPDDDCTNMCAFEDGFLIDEVTTCWTQGFIFCKEVSDLPAKFQTKLAINRSIPVPVLIAHLQALQIKLRPYGNVVPEEYQEPYCCILKKICTKLNATKKYSKKNVVNVKHSLSMCRFVMLDTGELVYSHQLCFDLEEDLGPFARAVPSYLQNFQKLFAAIGTPMISEAQAPPVVETCNGMINLSTLLLDARNNESYSDLMFALGEQKFFAHKLVVCSTCPVIQTMFSSGMKESMSARSTYTLPEWVEWEAFLMVMDYCYSGDWMYTRKVSTTDERDVSLVTEVLRLSDLFLMNHLKSCCEVFLSSVQIDVFNVCSLLQIAEMCNANQLESYCVFTIRIMFATVQQTEEWKDLRPDVQRKILAGSLFVGVDEEGAQ